MAVIRIAAITHTMIVATTIIMAVIMTVVTGITDAGTIPLVVRRIAVVIIPIAVTHTPTAAEAAIINATAITTKKATKSRMEMLTIRINSSKK